MEKCVGRERKDGAKNEENLYYTKLFAIQTSSEAESQKM